MSDDDNIVDKSGNELAIIEYTPESGGELTVAEYRPKFRPLVIYPSDTLRQVCQPVVDNEFQLPDMQKLCLDMLFMVRLAGAYGLAAPQVGVLKNIIVVNVHEQPFVLINPKIQVKSEELTKAIEEGCLSIPGYKARVSRHDKVVVAYQDEQGHQQAIEADDLAAVCLQHEIDHLVGKLFIDYLSPLKRNMAISKVNKSMKKLIRRSPRQAHRVAAV